MQQGCRLARLLAKTQGILFEKQILPYGMSAYECAFVFNYQLKTYKEYKKKAATKVTAFHYSFFKKVKIKRFCNL